MLPGMPTLQPSRDSHIAQGHLTLALWLPAFALLWVHQSCERLGSSSCRPCNQAAQAALRSPVYKPAAHLTGWVLWPVQAWSWWHMHKLARPGRLT